jgi:copper transport protein
VTPHPVPWLAAVTRRFAYLAAAVLLALLGVLTTALPASAHATIVSTNPADGAVLTRAPARVSVTFDEAVGVSTDSLRVFTPDGQRADTGVTAHGRQPQEITVALLPGLGHGTYTVGWHVISADSHPVQGAFTFSIGAPSSTAVNPAELGPPASRLVSVAFGVVRWLGFSCFALLIGAVAFVICCWPAGTSQPPALRLTMGAWGGLAGSTLAAVLLQGIYGAGQGIGHVFWPDVLHATLHSRYGHALGVRLLLVVAALVMFAITLGGPPLASRRARASAIVAWGILTAALAGTWAVADHAGTGIQVPLAMPSDIIHLSAMAIWLGGLGMLATIVLRRPRPAGPRPARGAAKRRGQGATAEAAQAVSRFSPIALGCVAAIVATGTYQAWRGVGTWGALTGTIYGRLLLMKIAGMCILIALGYLARRRIAEGLRAPTATTHVFAAVAAPAIHVKATAGVRAGHVKPSTGARPRGGAGNGTWPRGGAGNGARPRGGAGNGARPESDLAAVTLARLRWSVTAEAVIAAAVLAVTAVLVNTPTARETSTPSDRAAVAFDTGGPGGRGSIGLTVTPARLGPNQVRLSITGSTGRPYRPQQIQAVLSLPARHLGPLSVPLVADGTGRYLGGPVGITMTGQWQLRITIRSDAFDEATVAVPVSVH